MSMNKNKIEYYYENNDILQAKIRRLINENLDREEDILNKIAELSKIGIQIEIQKFSEDELKQFEVIDRVKKLSENTKNHNFIQRKQLDTKKSLRTILLNLKNIHFLRDIKQMIN